MNMSSLNVYKMLSLIAIGVIGHQVYPALFADNEATASAPEEISEVIPEPAFIVVKPEPAPSTKIKPHAMASEPKVSEIAEIAPEPIEPEPQPQPEEISPLINATLILVGKEAGSTIELKKDAELIERACYHGEWPQYRAMLARSLTEAVKESKSRFGRSNARYENLWREPKYYTALLRWKALSQFPDEVTSQTKSLSGGSEMITWVLNNDNALEEIALTLHENDNKDQVFKFLSTVWRNKKFTHKDEEFNQGDVNELEKIIPKYFNLALACAVVFDQEIAYKNHITGASNVDGMLRYHWYRKKNEGGLLEGDIHNASAKDLTFVVCSPVSTDELEWALKKYRSQRRKNIGQAFSDVKYLMERAVEGLNPYEEYTLPEILKEGGICGDQTYFCVNVARAAGIPAFGLSGLTNSGGHAWASVKIDDDEWSTQIGRIGGVSKGKGRDPQTGESITEQQIWHWSERKVASRTNTIDVFRHLWMADFFTESLDTPEKHEAINIAHNIGQEFPITWDRAYKVMLTREELISAPALSATLAVWKDFVKDLKHEFRKNPRMASLASVIEDKHIFPHSDIEDVRRELARLRRRNTKNSSEQADLMTSSLRRESDLILKTSDYDNEQALEEVHQLYSRSLRDYGGSLSGFKEMIQYYFSVMKEDKERGKASVQSIERAFNRVVDTGSDDWFRKKEEIAIFGTIAKMYREVGEEKRAASMEKRLTRDMKNADRKAL
ncbi:MAG: hypothetical protein ACJAR1_002642 [Rubritalea sp.]|jgi:hypothetical protein